MRKSRDPEIRNALPFPVSTGKWQIAFCLLFSIFFFLTFIPEKTGTGTLDMDLEGIWNELCKWKIAVFKATPTHSSQDISKIASNKVSHKWMLGHLPGKLGPLTSYSLSTSIAHSILQAHSIHIVPTCSQILTQMWFALLLPLFVDFPWLLFLLLSPWYKKFQILSLN